MSFNVASIIWISISSTSTYKVPFIPSSNSEISACVGNLFWFFHLTKLDLIWRDCFGYIFRETFIYKEYYNPTVPIYMRPFHTKNKLPYILNLSHKWRNLPECFFNLCYHKNGTVTTWAPYQENFWKGYIIDGQ